MYDVDMHSAYLLLNLLLVSLFTVSSLSTPGAVWHFVVESLNLSFSTGLISLTTPHLQLDLDKNNSSNKPRPRYRSIT